jgi:hypothetical protein
MRQPRVARRALVDRTPADRNRVVDLLRAAALVVIVLGHWVMQGLFVDAAGGLHRQGLLGIAPWTHPFTWALQVMPVLFLVGGYANALSWRRARLRGTGYAGWLRSRLERLARPLVPLLLGWTALAVAAPHLGLGEDWVRIAGRAALVPTWFLAVYLLVVALVPATLELWRRAGWWSVVLGAGAVAAVDALTIPAAGAGLAVLNALLVWGTVHQLGYAWLDGRFGTPPLRLGVGLAALASLVALVTWGPYAVSMVGVSGFGVDNTFPPRVTLVLLGLAQASLLLAIEPALGRLAVRPGVWRVVTVLNRRVMTTYLWHMTALGLVVAVVLALDLPALDADPAGSAWWWTRLPWFLVLALVTMLLVRATGGWEEPVIDRRAPPHPLRPVVAVTGTAAGIALLADRGLLAADGSPRWWLSLLPVLALLVGGVAIRNAKAGTVRKEQPWRQTARR